MCDRCFDQICLGQTFEGSKKLKQSLLNDFINIVNETKRKPSKLWVDQGREFCNSPMQKWLNDNILIYSTHNEGKSIIADRFIRTLKAKIYKKNDS